MKNNTTTTISSIVFLIGSLLFFSGRLFSQVTLGTSPYVQDFNSIAAGLPIGWSVRIGATSTGLGSLATYASTATSWATTTGNFRNVASATGLSSTSSSTDQGNSANRALALRQTGSFGDAGGSFSLQLANTTGKSNFSLSLKLQSLDASSPRLTTWLVQYGLGVNPSTFTTIATVPASLTTGASTFSNLEVTASFGSALNNQADNVWIRIVALSATTGSGNRPTSGIDDISLSWSASGSPAIAPSVSALAFDPTAIGINSVVKNYTLEGTALSGDVSLNTTAPFSISKNGLDFGQTLSYTPAELATPQSVSVRFSPLTAGPFIGSIMHTGGGAPDVSVALSGEGFDPSAPTYNFNGCIVNSEPGSGFTAISVAGAQVWGCTSFGRNSTNGVQINGFSGGAIENEDWLISPALNLSGFNVPILSFYSISAFAGPSLEVLVSTNYAGSGNPNIATWTALPVTLPAVASNSWTLSDNVLLLDYKTTNVYVAFKYSSGPALGASRWTLDDISIRNASGFLAASPTITDFGVVNPGTISVEKALQFRASGFGDITLQAPAPFELSSDGATFSTTVPISEAAALAGVNLQVRVSPAQKQLAIKGSLRAIATGLDSVVASFSASSYSKDSTFDVVTYNMYFLGSNIAGSGPADKALQRANFAAVLDSLQADIIGVEEVSDAAAMNLLMTDLGGEYDYILSPRWSYSFEPPDGTLADQKIGFIYKKSTVTLLESRPMFEQMYDAARGGASTPLDGYPTGTPSSFFASGRLPFMANFSVTIGAVTKQLRAVVVHAKSGGSDIQDWQRRVFDAKALKDSLDFYYGADPLMIVGDFNDRVIGSINPGQISPYKPFDDQADAFRFLTRLADSSGAASFLGSGGSMIDHLVASDEFFTEYIDSSAWPFDARAFVSNYTATTSDHLPVLARFDLKVPALLPVKLISFSGKKEENGIRLNWQTTGDSKTKYFEVQRSGDGVDFLDILKIDAPANGSRNFMAHDNYPFKGMNYYRLKMVDNNGLATLSKVIGVLNFYVQEQPLLVFPNPAAGNGVQLKLTDHGSNMTLQVINALGIVIAEAKGNLQSLNRSLAKTTAQMRDGIYFLIVTDGQKRHTTRLVIAR